MKGAQKPKKGAKKAPQKSLKEKRAAKRGAAKLNAGSTSSLTGDSSSHSRSA